MIKIGDNKLFSMTEILENLAIYLKDVPRDDIYNGGSDFEISAVAAVIGESADMVRGFVAAKSHR